MSRAAAIHFSPKDLARAVGMSESSLKRWADSGVLRVARTAGGHRRITLAEAVRFIRATRLPLVEPEALGLLDVSAAQVQLPLETDDAAHPRQRVLEDLLLAGKSAAARGLLASWYLGGSSLAELCDGPVAGAMHAVGELWRHDEAGIFFEHRATDIVIGALHVLRGLLAEPPADAPIALGGALAPDVYLIPSLMASIVLTAEGWHAHNLGPLTPIDSFTQAARQLRPRLIWLSLSVAQAARETSGDLGRLMENVPPGTDVIAGGRGVAGDEAPALPAGMLMINTMSGLAEHARGAAARD
jgi:methanogenic corrinoid protein MtbC1